MSKSFITKGIDEFIDWLALVLMPLVLGLCAYVGLILHYGATYNIFTLLGYVFVGAGVMRVSRWFIEVGMKKSSKPRAKRREDSLSSLGKNNRNSRYP